MKIECAYNELVELHKLIPNPRNPNKHSSRQIDMLAKIIDFQGQRAPIVVSKRSGFLVVGHGRLEAIKKLGWEKCAVDFQDFKDEATEHAHMIADNKISELSETDNDMLIELSKDLGDDFDIELLGLGEDLPMEESEDEVQDIDKEKLDLVILQCPHCSQSFEQSAAKIVG